MTTALLVIDMQNAFLHPKGENHYPAAPEVVHPCLDLIATAETNKAIIVHVADTHRAGFKDFEQPKLPSHGIDGGFDAAFFDGFGPMGRAHEIALKKRRYSAFFATELALFLREQDVRRVVICGVKTNVCVRATAQDAFAHGFGVVVVGDAVNTNRAHLGEASLEEVSRYLGQVVTLSEAKEMLSSC